MRSDSQSGFTLIELLIALMLAGFLCVVLFAALRLGGATLNRVTLEQTNMNDDLNTQQVITRWLQNAYPKYLPPGLSGQTSHIYFDGESSSVSFLGPAPLSITPAGMAYMRIEATGPAGHAALILSARPELAWPGPNQTVMETLLTGFAKVDFAYFGSDEPNGKKTWRHFWKNKMFLPSLIRLQIRFKPGDARTWPVLLIAPKIFADQSCQFQQITQSCLGR